MHDPRVRGRVTVRHPVRGDIVSRDTLNHQARELGKFKTFWLKNPSHVSSPLLELFSSSIFITSKLTRVDEKYVIFNYFLYVFSTCAILRWKIMGL